MNKVSYDKEIRLIKQLVEHIHPDDERAFARAWRRELASHSFESTRILMNLLSIHFDDYKVARILTREEDTDLPTPKVDAPNLYFNAYTYGRKAMTRVLLDEYTEDVVSSDQFILAFRTRDGVKDEVCLEAVCASTETTSRLRDHGFGARVDWTEDQARRSAVFADKVEEAGLRREKLRDELRRGICVTTSKSGGVVFKSKDVIALAKSGLQLRKARALFEERAKSETYDTVQAFQEAEMDWSCLYDVLKHASIRRAVMAGVVTTNSAVEAMLAAGNEKSKIL